MTSHKKCAILYSRKQEPNSSLEREAERQRKYTASAQMPAAFAARFRGCQMPQMRWCQQSDGSSFWDHGSERKQVNALQYMHDPQQAAKYSGRSKLTRKERVPWAYWISRAVAIGSAVSTIKRIRTRTYGPSDLNSMIYINELPCLMENGITYESLQQGYHI